MAFGTNSTTPAGFNEQDYLRLNPDVAQAVQRGDFQSGLQHYQNHGMNEGRSFASPTNNRASAPPIAPPPTMSTKGNTTPYVTPPTSLPAGQKFGTTRTSSGVDNTNIDYAARYLDANPDVKAAGVDPWTHYQQHGKAEGRTWGPAGFDADWYRKTYGDVANSGMDPLQHYTQHGQFEDRSFVSNNPNALAPEERFDPQRNYGRSTVYGSTVGESKQNMNLRLQDYEAQRVAKGAPPIIKGYRAVETMTDPNLYTAQQRAAATDYLNFLDSADRNYYIGAGQIDPYYASGIRGTNEGLHSFFNTQMNRARSGDETMSTGLRNYYNGKGDQQAANIDRLFTIPEERLTDGTRMNPIEASLTQAFGRYSDFYNRSAAVQDARKKGRERFFQMMQDGQFGPYGGVDNNMSPPGSNAEQYWGLVGYVPNHDYTFNNIPGTNLGKGMANFLSKGSGGFNPDWAWVTDPEQTKPNPTTGYYEIPTNLHDILATIQANQAVADGKYAGPASEYQLYRGLGFDPSTSWTYQEYEPFNPNNPRHQFYGQETWEGSHGPATSIGFSEFAPRMPEIEGEQLQVPGFAYDEPQNIQPRPRAPAPEPYQAPVIPSLPVANPIPATVPVQQVAPAVTQTPAAPAINPFAGLDYAALYSPEFQDALKKLQLGAITRGEFEFLRGTLA